MYLSTAELMATVNASPFFGRCVFHSPRLLRKNPWLLWLCPTRKVALTWYEWTWQKLDEYGLPIDPVESETNDEVKLVPRANSKTADMEFSCRIAPVQPITVCPLAQLWDLKKDQVPKGFTTTADSAIYNTIGITATPSELELYGAMLLADPPVYEACAKLWYSHSAIPGCYITGERTVKSGFPLTVRGFLDAAFRMKGETTVVHDEKFDDPVAGVVLRSDSFEEVILERIRALGGHFDLVFNRSPVCFRDVRILRSDEWVHEERKFAEQLREALV
jgi:hypothetical protein